MKILITGAAGLLGSNLLKELLDREHQVIGLDDFSFGHSLNIAPFLSHPGFTFIQESILNIEKLESVSRDVEVIFHLAALKIPRYGGYLKTLEVNARGTEHVLECARKQGSRVIFASTDEVYGKNSESSFSEGSTMVLGESRVARWSLAASKIYGEHLCFAYAEKYHVPISILRYSGIYGPTFQLSSLSGVQDVFIYAALTGQPIPIHGDGTQSRPFTHISDAMDATLKVLDSPNADGEVLNIGGGPTISVVNLAYLIWRMTGTTRKLLLRFIPYTDFSRLYEDPQHRVVETSKARYLLDYASRISLEEGMRLQVEWIRTHLGTIQESNPTFSLDMAPHPPV
jgi:UDP-glucose 4-epimerase